MDNSFYIPVYLIFVDTDWDARLSCHDNRGPSVPFNRIVDLLMDARRRESQNGAHRHALVLLLKQLKEWQKIHLIKGREKHMLALVLMDQVAHCGQPEFEKQIIYLSCFVYFITLFICVTSHFQYFARSPDVWKINHVKGLCSYTHYFLSSKKVGIGDRTLYTLKLVGFFSSS